MIKSTARSITAFVRSNFFAGLFIAVPFGITIVFLIWLWDKINGPLASVFTTATEIEKGPFGKTVGWIEASEYQRLLVPILGLMILMIGILVLGIAARSIIGRIALAIVEGVVGRVPVVGMLYSSLKQLGEAFITTDGQSKFQKAVAVQFPYRGSWAVGFVTGKADAMLRNIPANELMSKDPMLTVFVPTTPLPTAGFMMVVPESETLALDMSVQDALKLVVSGGIISPGESQKQRAQSKTARLTAIIARAKNVEGGTAEAPK